MPALPTKKGKQRQKAILESAIDVLIANGYEGTSLDKILKISGGSRTTIYKTYGSKQGLFLAALESMVEELYSEYAEQYDEKRTWEEELVVFGNIFLKGILSRRAIGAARLIYSESARFPDIGKWYYEQGALLSYSCFAKVLENHIALDFEELKGIARIYIEMLKNNIYLKALCLPGFESDDAMIARDVAESAEIIKTHIRKRISAKPD